MPSVNVSFSAMRKRNKLTRSDPIKSAQQTNLVRSQKRLRQNRKFQNVGRETETRFEELIDWMLYRKYNEARLALTVILKLKSVDTKTIESCTRLTEQEQERAVSEYEKHGIKGWVEFFCRKASYEQELPIAPAQYSISFDELGNTAKEEAFSLTGDNCEENWTSITSPKSLPSAECEEAILTTNVIPNQLGVSQESSSFNQADQRIEPASLEIWQNIEPLDTTDASSHDDNRHDKGQSNWHIFGSSRRGKYHAHTGMYREDCFEYGFVNEWNVIALSDGAGSARLARVGSKLATKSAVEKLKTELKKLMVFENDEISNELGLKTALLDSTWHARMVLNEEAERRCVEINELDTTLLLLVHTQFANRSVIGVMQVGDGLIAIWDGESIVELGIPDQGQYSGETQFLTRIKHLEELVPRISVNSLGLDMKYAMMMTDGIADDFYPASRELPRLLKYIPNFDQTTPDVFAEQLTNLIGYRRKGSHDDRTFVMLIPSHSANEVSEK